MQLLSLGVFFILTFFVFYLPGRFLLRLAGFKFPNFVITFSVSMILGISLFLLGTYILSWFNLAIFYNLVILVILYFELRHSFFEFKQIKGGKNIPGLEYWLIILGSIVMAYITWNSGVYQGGSLLFYGVNGGDSIYHLALIGSLISHFPPFHPGLSGVPLHGYNFFYDFLVSNFAKFYSLNVLDLFFRNFSLFISLMYGVSSLALAKFLKWSKITTFLFIILMYFAQSFDFFAFYVYRFFNFYYNSSGITQSFSNILDPSIVVAISFMFVGFILLFSKKTKWSFLLSVLVIGIIPQIKIYSGIIFYAGLFFVALTDAIKNKNGYYFKILTLSGILSAFVYLPINSGAGGLIFAPFLIYKNFIDSAWLFNNWHWNVNYVIYLQHNNYIHLAYFYFIAITIFILTGLGIRASVFLSTRRLLNRKFYTLENVFWASGILISFLIPSFFVQSVSSFSIIQFFWVGYILLLIPTAVVLGQKMEGKSKLFLTISLIFLSILFLPDALRSFVTYSINPNVFVPETVKQASEIKKIPKNEGVIVVNRVEYKGKYQDIYTIPLYSGLSGHSIYYEHELTEFQGLGNITDVRKKNIDKISGNIGNCKDPAKSEENIIKIMQETNNKYLLVLNKTKCISQYSKLKVVNNEEKSVIFKI